MGTGPSIEHKNLDTLGKHVQYLSDTTPDRELFVFYNKGIRTSYTCRQLYELGGRFAFRLRNHYGFQSKDVIANTLNGSPERLITDLGIILAGCIPMNVQILLSDGADFLQSARVSQCKAIVLCPEGNRPAYRLLKRYIQDTPTDVAQFSKDDLPDLKKAILVSRDSRGKPFLEDLKMSEDEIFVEENVAPDDVLTILTTSGSTGYSKLIPWTHTMKLLHWKTFAQTGLAKNFSFCKYFSNASLGWTGGSPYTSYFCNCTRVMLDGFNSKGPSNVEEVWSTITQEKCEFGYIGSQEADNVVKHVQTLGGNQHKFKILFFGGQPFRKLQVQRLFTLTECAMNVYGSSECGVTCVKATEDIDAAKDFCVGRPILGADVRIVNEEGETCSPGDIGIMQIKNKWTFKGYFNRLEDPDPQTKQAFTSDGWLNTSDTSYLDEDGEVHVMGRANDVIMYGQKVLYPGWLEARLLTNPKISEACVVPVSDPITYHKLCACVEPIKGSNLDEDELEEFCKNIFISDLDDSLTPMPQFFLIMDSMPQAANSKADKKVLRQMAEDKFGVKNSDAC